MADPQNPLLDLLRALGVVQQQQNAGNVQLAQQQGQNQVASQRAQRATAQDVLFGQRLGRYGTPIDRETGVESGNPFDNGFFKTNAQRNEIIADRQAGMPNIESLNFNPFFQAGELARNTPNVSVDAPLPFTQILNEPIAPPALDGGASAQDRTARALRARRNPFSIF